MAYIKLKKDGDLNIAQLDSRDFSLVLIVDIAIGKKGEISGRINLSGIDLSISLHRDYYAARHRYSGSFTTLYTPGQFDTKALLETLSSARLLWF